MLNAIKKLFNRVFSKDTIEDKQPIVENQSVDIIKDINDNVLELDNNNEYIYDLTEIENKQEYSNFQNEFVGQSVNDKNQNIIDEISIEVVDEPNEIENENKSVEISIDLSSIINADIDNQLINDSNINNQKNDNYEPVLANYLNKIQNQSIYYWKILIDPQISIKRFDNFNIYQKQAVFLFELLLVLIDELLSYYRKQSLLTDYLYIDNNIDLNLFSQIKEIFDIYKYSINYDEDKNIILSYKLNKLLLSLNINRNDNDDIVKTILNFLYNTLNIQVEIFDSNSFNSLISDNGIFNNKEESSKEIKIKNVVTTDNNNLTKKTKNENISDTVVVKKLSSNNSKKKTKIKSKNQNYRKVRKIENINSLDNIELSEVIHKELNERLEEQLLVIKDNKESNNRVSDKKKVNIVKRKNNLLIGSLDLENIINKFLTLNSNYKLSSKQKKHVLYLFRKLIDDYLNIKNYEIEIFEDNNVNKELYNVVYGLTPFDEKAPYFYLFTYLIEYLIIIFVFEKSIDEDYYYLTELNEILKKEIYSFLVVENLVYKK